MPIRELSVAVEDFLPLRDGATDDHLDHPLFRLAPSYTARNSAVVQIMRTFSFAPADGTDPVLGAYLDVLIIRVVEVVGKGDDGVLAELVNEECSRGRESIRLFELREGDLGGVAREECGEGRASSKGRAPEGCERGTLVGGSGVVPQAELQGEELERGRGDEAGFFNAVHWG